MALNEYTGSLILVSHDAFLVERLVDRLLIVKDGNVLEFNGDIHEYRKLVLSNNNSKKNKKSNVLSTGVKKQGNVNLSLSDLQKKLKICEKNITDYEKKKSSLQTSILDKDFYNSKNDKEIQEVNNQLKIILSLILEEEKNWEEITDNIEIKKS